MAFEMLRASVPGDDDTGDGTGSGDTATASAPEHARPIVDGDTTYPDFAACVAANGDKDDPEAYCAALEAAQTDDEPEAATDRTAPVDAPTTDTVSEQRDADENAPAGSVDVLAASGDTADTDNGANDDGEGWGATATAMVEVFVPEPDETDDERRSRYAALLPRYRRAGRTPPEWLTMAELDAIEVGSRLWRALFLEDEVNAARQRAGQVLAKRNAERIRSARSLLQDVLDDARITDDAPGDGDDGDGAGRAVDAPDAEPVTSADTDTLAAWRAVLQSNTTDTAIDRLVAWHTTLTTTKG
jgi:hypothetical protein